MTSHLSSEAIRSGLDHPIIDGDGHTVEYIPALMDYLREVGGPSMLARYEKFSTLPWYEMTTEERRAQRVTRPGFWTRPTRNTRDRATAMLPKLRRERMDELGTDFAVIYPSLGLYVVRAPDDELRRAVCRAINMMHADIFRDYADRMTPAATIPMHTPEEAIAELEYCVRELGFKAAMFASQVQRPIPAIAAQYPDIGERAGWIDNLALDSAYDYDPVWAKCMELRIAVTGHSLSMGWGARATVSNFMYNHIGHFAASGELFCKALFMGGVTRRFPDLKFGFLEGGVSWAVQLYHDLVGHWDKRNLQALEHLNPANLDRELLTEMFMQYGGKMVEGQPREDVAAAIQLVASSRDGLGKTRQERAEEIDDYAACGIQSKADIDRLFLPNFFFGCEADDPTTAWAFTGNPRLKALFSSDVGHWDVPDMAGCVAEAWEAVDDGLMSREDFQEFTFTNPALLHAGMNPDFFKGTVIENEVAKLLKGQA